MGTLSTVAEGLGTVVEEAGGAAAAGHSLKPEPDMLRTCTVFIHINYCVCMYL